MLPKLTETTQTISFSEGDVVNSAEIFANEVIVSTNIGNHNHGSSKFKLKNLVDYNWEPKFYSGQLLAIHLTGSYLAYSIKAPNALNQGSWTGMVRVVYNSEPGTDKRALIKGMKGEVQDLAFAHIENQVVLASIDELGNFYVHEIEIVDGALRCTLIAEVREDTGLGGGNHRVVWCPYIPDEEDYVDDDVARLLLTTHANVARMWNIQAVSASLRSPDKVGLASILSTSGAVTTKAHDANIVDAAFSPDGTALATAALDGYVMFFQVFIDIDSSETSPRCLHKWQPHGGAPLSCLFFLDNHKNYNTDVQFWKFAVTGAHNNTILKIWSCKSWNCLQTITFSPGIDTEASLGLKAMLDRSASYLILSDFKAKSMYVLNVARDIDDTLAYFRSISEFLLPYPVLSFCIVDAGEEIEKCESRCDDPFHRNGSSGDIGGSPDDFDLHNEGEGSSVTRGEKLVRVKLYIVQPKGLQEGELTYSLQGIETSMANLTLTEEISDAPAVVASSILQQQSQQLKNLLMRSQTQPGSLISTRPESPPIPPPLNLMTPDAFSSPGKREEDDPPLSATPDVSGLPRTSGAGPMSEVPVPPEIDGKLTSGGSSPSREVQQIMALNSDYYKQPMEDEDEESSQTPVAEEEEPNSVIENGEENIFNEVFLPQVAQEKPLPSAKLTHSNSDTSWPQISVPQINEANQRKASSEKSSCQSLNNSGIEKVIAEEKLVGLSVADRTRLESLEQKLDKLTELLVAQSHELVRLRTEVHTASAAPQQIVESAMNAHAQLTAQQVKAALTDGWDRIQVFGDTAAARAAQSAGVGAARALEPLAAALQHELAAKLTATDQLLRDNIEKLVNSKTVMEQLSNSIVHSLSGMVQQSFKQALISHVVPAVEKAHAAMFKQLNHALLQGTREYTQNTEAAARAAAERGSSSAVASLRSALERHAEILAASANATPNQHQLTSAIKEAAHSVLEKEMCWWREQARSVAIQMSRAHTPATPATPHSSVQDRQMQMAQINSLMSAGDINGAFQLALSASELSLVVAACRAAEPTIVFAPPCKLKQHVLLSLIQQLAADMSNDTTLKHRYLEEAIMNLDTSNPVTREHLPAVIRELQKQIMTFLNSHPGHTLTRQFKMLLMATESLVKNAV